MRSTLRPVLAWAKERQCSAIHMTTVSLQSLRFTAWVAVWAPRGQAGCDPSCGTV